MPTKLLPSGEKVKLPDSIIKAALLSLPSPSFNSIFLPLLVTLIELFAGCKLPNTICLPPLATGGLP